MSDALARLQRLFDALDIGGGYDADDVAALVQAVRRHVRGEPLASALGLSRRWRERLLIEARNRALRAEADELSLESKRQAASVLASRLARRAASGNRQDDGLGRILEITGGEVPSEGTIRAVLGG